MTRRLALERATAVADGGGGAATAWTEAGLHWAEVSARAGEATLLGGVETSQVTHRVIVWGAPHGAPSRPAPGDRFREGRRLFRVLAVAEGDPEGRFLTCWVEEEGAR